MEKANGRLVQLIVRKRIVWVALFTIVFIHVSSTLFQFIFSCLAPSTQSIPPHIFSIRLDLAYLPATYIFLILLVEVSREDVVRHLFYNFYHDSSDDGPRKLWQFSLEEFLPLYIVFLMRVVGIFLIPAVFLTEPQVSMLYSYLVAQNTHWFGSLVLAAAVEMLAATFWLTNVGFLVILHCLSCSRVRSEFGKAGKLLRYKTARNDYDLELHLN